MNEKLGAGKKIKHWGGRELMGKCIELKGKRERDEKLRETKGTEELKS